MPLKSLGQGSLKNHASQTEKQKSVKQVCSYPLWVPQDDKNKAEVLEVRIYKTLCWLGRRRPPNILPPPLTFKTWMPWPKFENFKFSNFSTLSL